MYIEGNKMEDEIELAEMELKDVIICPGCDTLQAPLVNEKCLVCSYPFNLLKEKKYFRRVK